MKTFLSKFKKKIQDFYTEKLKCYFKTSNFKILLIIFSSLFLSLYLFGKNLDSKWWYLDDHEIMKYLGDDGKISLNELPEVLINDTEVGDYGSYERYRPSYFVLRLLGSVIWGNNPEMWYLSRILIITVFLSIIWYVVWKEFNLVTGFFIVIAVLSANYWGELISRLGPAETYTVLGLSLFILGIYKQVKNINYEKKDFKNLFLWQILMVLGALIAIGCKENFLILLVPVFLVFFYFFIKKKMNLGLIISMLVILTYSSLIISSIYLAISKSGEDIYGNSINLKSLIALTYHHIPIVLKIFKIKLLTIAVISSSLVLFLLKRKKGFNKYLKNILMFFLVTICLMGFYLFQVFFYKGIWPTGMRYDFPGLLYLPFMALNIVFLIRTILDYINVNVLVREQIYSFVFILGIIILSPKTYFSYLRNYTLENVQRTVSYTNTIDSIVAEAKSRPDSPIFIEAYVAMDYELIYSVHRFLSSYGVKNPIYVNLNNIVANTYFENKLLTEMNSVSEKGGYFVGDYFTERTGNVEKTEGCISVYMSGYGEDICNSFVIR